MKTLSKILTGIFILSLTFPIVTAQNYEVTVTSGQKVIIENLLGKIIIKDYSGSNLKIECTGFGKVSEKAQGLQEIYDGGIDNTGIGLSIQESAKTILINGASKRSEDAKYTFFVPANVSVKIDYSSPFSYDDLEVIGFSRELEVKTLNAGIELIDVTGPLTIHTINGDIKTDFKSLNQESPTSLSSINGDLDITVPASTKAALKLGTMQGEIYTDCDIEFEKKKEKEHDNWVMIGGNSNSDGKLNGGGIELTLNSINGSIYLRKK